jgi:hypothetical protein
MQSVETKIQYISSQEIAGCRMPQEEVSNIVLSQMRRKTIKHHFITGSTSTRRAIAIRCAASPSLM